MIDLALPMAHEILAFERQADRSVVLCHLPNNTATPWATWRVDCQGNCYWGHYLHTEAEAREDFADRTRESRRA
jgi:hypothetical protein